MTLATNNTEREKRLTSSSYSWNPCTRFVGPVYVEVGTLACVQTFPPPPPIFLWGRRAVCTQARGPQVGEVTRLGGVTRLSIKSLILIWSHLHDRWGDPPRVTSPIWGPSPPCKQAPKHPGYQPGPDSCFGKICKLMRFMFRSLWWSLRSVS